MAAAKQQFSLGKSQVSKDMMTAFMEGAIEEEITTVPGIGTCGMGAAAGVAHATWAHSRGNVGSAACAPMPQS
jgi:hypothetical protein